MRKRRIIARLELACAIGGVSFAVVLWTMVSVQDLPPAIRQLFETRGYILRTLFFLSQIGFMSGLYALLIADATDRSKLRKSVLSIPFLGQLGYLTTSLLPNQTVTTLLPLPLTQLGAILNTVGMVLVGIAVLRGDAWHGWPRPLPLLTGLCPFLIMFPVLAITSYPPRALIDLWGLVWMALGYAIYSSAAYAKSIRREIKISV
ncbi:MAG: hypothetical protein H7Z75_16610 [Ferruginibacter sp.]|nr:hypothetical protein [Cytophagales bacterium]